MIETALTDAVRRLIIDNAGAIPGYDLREIFQMPLPRGDFPQLLPGESAGTRFG